MNPEENKPTAGQSATPTMQNADQSAAANTNFFGTPANAPVTDPNLPTAPVQDPTAPQQPEQPQTNPSDPIRTTTLGVPVLSPTHFDNQVVPNQPTIEQLAQQAQAAQPVTTDTDQKTLKKLKTMSIVFGALAVVFLGVGIFGLIFGLSANDKFARAESELNEKTAVITALEETTGVSPINTPDEVPVYKPTLGYIYIGSWNIKLKVPEDLTDVSYILDQKYRPSICFNAIGAGVRYFPAFADVAKNPGGMGCLTRVATSEGNTAADTGQSFGTKVFTYKDFSYFYTPPAKVYSTDEAEKGLEATAVQLIKNMLTDNISQYE